MSVIDLESLVNQKPFANKGNHQILTPPRPVSQNNNLSFSNHQPLLQQLQDGPFKDFVIRVIKVNKIESIKATIALSTSIVESMLCNDYEFESIRQSSKMIDLPSKSEMILQE